MNKYPQDLQDLEEKINHFKNKSEKPKHKKSFAWEYNMAICAVIDFVSPIFAGICIGYALDCLFHILPICLIVFSIFGMIAGILNIYKIYGATNTEKQE